MRAQFAKQRFFRRRYALTDDRNSKPRDGRLFRRAPPSQTVGIIYRGLTKGIQLVGRPEVSRELFDE